MAAAAATRQRRRVMRRRRLVKLPAAVSGVLCAAALALWVRSYGRADVVWWYPADGQRRIVSSVNGGLQVQQYVASNALWEGLRRGHMSGPPGIVGIGYWPASWRFAGFAYYNDTRPPPGTTIVNMRGARIPYWFLFVMTAATPAWWLWRARLRRALAARRRGALCRRCGYDLRATPDRCPECGTVVDRVAPT